MDRRVFNIAILDDEFDIAFLLAEQLNDFPNILAREFTSSLDFIPIIHRYDMVISDYFMPFCDGFELVKRTPDFKGIRVLMSGNLPNHFDDSPFSLVIEKPISNDDMIKLLKLTRLGKS